MEESQDNACQFCWELHHVTRKVTANHSYIRAGLFFFFDVIPYFSLGGLRTAILSLFRLFLCLITQSSVSKLPCEVTLFATSFTFEIPALCTEAIA